MKLVVTPEVRALGIDACMALVSGARVSNRSNPLEKRKKEALDAIRALDVGAHPVLAAYRELHRQARAEGVVPPAQHLIALAQETGRLPNINTVVDCYNLVSARTGLSIGAHNAARVRGDVAFRVATGSERYTPLGASAPVPVRAGEYACMDDEKIICRMDVKQCEETRITKATGAFLVYVQGNRATSADQLGAALRELCDLVRDVCGGSCEVVPMAAAVCVDRGGAAPP
jgi:methionyl-tRNA synthetase